MDGLEQGLIVGALLLVAGVLASKLSDRLGLPALLFFLAIGMAGGSEAIGGVEFRDAALAQSLGVVALALILFSGGLDTEWPAVAAVWGSGVRLASLGVLLTALVVAGFVHWIVGFSWQEALLLGSIVSSTDAAAVFAVLRSRNASLKGRLRPLLELESGSNDPMAVFLTVGCIRLLVEPTARVSDLAPLFLLQMGLGALSGVAFGKLTVAALNRLRLESEGLYPVLTLALVLAAYSATALVGGNGFLAVYLAGLMMASEDFIHKRSLIRFHDGLAWLFQIVMFVVLGLLVVPSHLAEVAGPGLLVSAALMLMARPAGVLVSLVGAGFSLREKVLIAWVGLRGAVPIILATFPLLAGLPHAELHFNVVFFVVITSALLQGTTLAWVARRLGLEAPLPSRPERPVEFLPGRRTTSRMLEFEVAPGSKAAGRQIVDLRLPKTTLVVLVSRKEDYLVPKGGTVLEAGDRVMLLADEKDVEMVGRLLGAGEKGD